VAVETHLPAIASVIQLAVAPVFLLTAVGTIIAALNYRLGRAVDRRRSLERRLAKMDAEELGPARDELATIALRIRYTYLSILASVVSALFVCLLIAAAFLGAFVRVDLSATIGTLFVLSILSLVACLLLFLREIFLAVSTPRHVPR
jgi:hypothetical protein